MEVIIVIVMNEHQEVFHIPLTSAGRNQIIKYLTRFFFFKYQLMPDYHFCMLSNQLKKKIASKDIKSLYPTSQLLFTSVHLHMSRKPI